MMVREAIAYSACLLRLTELREIYENIGKGDSLTITVPMEDFDTLYGRAVEFWSGLRWWQVYSGELKNVRGSGEDGSGVCGNGG